jgi:hypothetical protein
MCRRVLCAVPTPLAVVYVTRTTKSDGRNPRNAKKKVYILNIAILTLSFVIPRARVYDMRRAHTPKIDICHIKKKDPTANVGLPKLVSAVEGSRGASLIYSQLAFYRRCTVKGQSEPLQWRRLSGTVKSPTSN